MNIAIIGCGYVGIAVARLWRSAGHAVTVTTTKKERVAELEKVAQRVVVARGDDSAALKEAVENQDVVLLSVGAANGSVYRETYLETAKKLGGGAGANSQRAASALHRQLFGLWGQEWRAGE
jgi:predicted dinucleotide-binding enzyme